MKKLNLPSEATVEISAQQNKTVIGIDVGLHPHDIEKLHAIIDNFLLNETEDSIRIINEVNEHYRSKTAPESNL